jgi:hypothetical protein
VSSHLTHRGFDDPKWVRRILRNLADECVGVEWNCWSAAVSGSVPSDSGLRSACDGHDGKDRLAG